MDKITELQRTLKHPERYDHAVVGYWRRNRLADFVDPDNTAEDMGEFIRRVDTVPQDEWEWMTNPVWNTLTPIR